MFKGLDVSFAIFRSHFICLSFKAYNYSIYSVLDTFFGQIRFWKLLMENLPASPTPKESNDRNFMVRHSLYLSLYAFLFLEYVSFMGHPRSTNALLIIKYPTMLYTE